MTTTDLTTSQKRNINVSFSITNIMLQISVVIEAWMCEAIFTDHFVANLLLIVSLK